MTYTHTRISRDHLEKLQALAARHNRSARRQLEVLVDKAVTAANKQDLDRNGND